MVILGTAAALRSQAKLILTLEPLRLRISAATQHSTAPATGSFCLRGYSGFTSFCRSKLSPFFHKVKVTAAILRASVTCANSGSKPRSSSRW